MINYFLPATATEIVCVKFYVHAPFMTVNMFS